MFPEVYSRPLIALKKYCANKEVKRTMAFLDRVWDSRALNAMMSITKTDSIESLSKWLVDPDNDKKIQLIIKQ